MERQLVKWNKKLYGNFTSIVSDDDLIVNLGNHHSTIMN